MHVRSEDDSLSVREEVWPKVRVAVVRHLPLVRSVGIHHPDLERRRTNQILLQQVQVILLVFLGLRVIRAIDDLLTVVRPEWTTVVSKLVRQLPHVLAVGIHRVYVESAAA